jgi:hypothetical protein
MGDDKTHTKETIRSFGRMCLRIFDLDHRAKIIEDLLKLHKEGSESSHSLVSESSHSYPPHDGQEGGEETLYLDDVDKKGKKVNNNVKNKPPPATAVNGAARSSCRIKCIPLPVKVNNGGDKSTTANTKKVIKAGKLHIFLEILKKFTFYISLESDKKQTVKPLGGDYDDLLANDLKNELNKRGIKFANRTSKKALIQLLEDVDDEGKVPNILSKKTTYVE